MHGQGTAGRDWGLRSGNTTCNAKSKNKLAQCKSDVIVYEWFIEARAGSTSASTDKSATRYTHRVVDVQVHERDRAATPGGREKGERDESIARTEIDMYSVPSRWPDAPYRSRIGLPATPELLRARNRWWETFFFFLRNFARKNFPRVKRCTKGHSQI